MSGSQYVHSINSFAVDVLGIFEKKKKRNPEEKNVQKKSEGDKREAEGEKRGEKQVSLGGGGPVFMMDRSRE